MSKNKYIETPQRLWELFLEYREDLRANPRIKIEYVGKEGTREETPLQRPLTIEGFKVYCYENVGDIQAYWNNRDKAYSEYSPIITRIRETIRQEQLEGGLLGEYNANLTARINGLTDKQQHTIQTEQPLFPDTSQDNTAE